MHERQIQVRQPGEAAMSKVPGPGTAQGGQRLLLTGLLQGNATSLPVRVCMLLHVLHSVSGGCGGHDVEHGNGIAAQCIIWYRSPRNHQTLLLHCSKPGRSINRCTKSQRRIRGCLSRSGGAPAARRCPRSAGQESCGRTVSARAARRVGIRPPPPTKSLSALMMS